MDTEELIRRQTALFLGFAPVAIRGGVAELTADELYNLAGTLGSSA